MIGTIIQMQHSGITKTEIILNSSAYANSKFFGAKISFERYSTAPDSYNITLTGPNEAVSLFNDNMEGLVRSFQRSKLNFRVGKLSAEYSSERPLFKRKPKLSDEKNEM